MDVTLVLTHDCNLACGYCYAGEKLKRTMSLEIGLKGLDLAFADHSKSVELAFFGGEPLLEWEMLVELADMARSRAAEEQAKLALAVTTNGTLLDPTRAKKLDELGFHVGLSIDGIREAHNIGRPRRGGKPSFDQVRRGLVVLLERGSPFQTISVVTPDNVGWLGESVAWLIEQGVPHISLNPCYEAGFSDAALEPYGAGLERAAEELVAAYRAGRIIAMSVFDNKILAALKGGLAETDTCSFGSRSCAVAPSGNIYACERMVGNDTDAKSAIGHVTRGITPPSAPRRPGPVNSECATCAERWRCGSHCACANMAETGRPDVAGGTQCWHERRTAALADRIAETLWAERNPWFIAWFYGRSTNPDAVKEILAQFSAQPSSAALPPINRPTQKRLPVLT